MCNFYVYVFLDPRKPGLFSYDEFQFRNEPFYVGKGSKNRDSEHFKPSEIKRDYNPYKNRKIKKIQKIGMKPVILRIKESLTESQAFDLEIKTIQTIGRKKDGGPLTNLYDGGFGTTKSKEVRQKIGDSMRKWHSQNKHPSKGKPVSKERRQNISKARQGIANNPASIEKIRQTKLTTSRPKNTRWWKLISPKNEEFKVFGLGQFCRERGLAKSHLIAVANGHRKQHKGWKAEHLVATNR